MNGWLLAGLFVIATAGATVPVHGQVNENAARTFREMIEAHRAWASVRVKATLKITVEQEGVEASGEEVAAEFVHRADGHGIIKLADWDAYISGDVIYVTHKTNADEYYKDDAIANVHSDLVWEGFGSFDRVPFPHLAIFWGATDFEELYMELYADTPELVPTGLADRVLDGRSVRTIEMTGPSGRMEINLDPRTFEIHSIRQEISQSWMLPEGAKRINSHTFEYERFDQALPDAEIAFVPGDRQFVDFMASLEPQESPAMEFPGELLEPPPQLTGNPAPPFKLPTPEGEVIELEKLRGNVVVIDFWAEWCPPCRAALPELHNVAAWAKEQELPVEIFAVNTFESGKTLEDKVKVVTDFWEKVGHTLPVLMDHEGKAADAYGVQGVPATFVIDPDGIVIAEHSGFGKNYAELLKEDIQRALKN